MSQPSGRNPLGRRRLLHRSTIRIPAARPDLRLRRAGALLLWLLLILGCLGQFPGGRLAAAQLGQEGTDGSPGYPPPTTLAGEPTAYPEPRSTPTPQPAPATGVPTRVVVGQSQSSSQATSSPQTAPGLAGENRVSLLLVAMVGVVLLFGVILALIRPGRAG